MHFTTVSYVIWHNFGAFSDTVGGLGREIKKIYHPLKIKTGAIFHNF